MKYQEMENNIKDWYKKLNPIYKKSFWLSLAFINLAFLFHTVSFMFGDHDWLYIRHPNYWSEGSFEGRPLHFVLQSIFFNGHVLPILNNLFSFIALSISGIILARYWKIPVNSLNYTVFTIFVATLPLTLVWLFYAKDALINLSLPLIAIGGLYLADNTKNIIKHILAIILFYFAFASYAAIINLLGVVFLGGILIAYINGEKLTSLIKEKLPAVIDISIALLLFQITLLFMKTKGLMSAEYNTQTIPLDILPQKLIETLEVMFTQFITPIPFMEYKYKLALLILCILGVILAYIKSGILKAPLVTILILAILFSSKIAFFMAEERGQVLAEMENFAFVPRLDFYGLAYVYALGLALALSYSKLKIYKVITAFVIIITFYSSVRDMYAQKVWKLGFDAEMKAHERIVSRLEQLPNFYKDRKYKLLQIGSLSLRKNYYREVEGEEKSLDLLETSFTPQYMSRIVYNFYYPEDIFIDNVTINDLTSRGQSFLKYAKAWPSQESIFIDGDIVIIVLTKEGLDKAKAQLR